MKKKKKPQAHVLAHTV